VVEVSDGYARNYLIPHHLALEPTDANMKAIEEDKKRAEADRKAKRHALEAAVARLANVEVMIHAAANPEGHLYGSVGPREIAAALRDEGHNVEASNVELHETIRQLGTRTVPVIFGDDLRAEVKVWVVQEKAAGDLETAGKEEAAGTEAGEDGESTSESAESAD
jgi:large subunit ribosomal protein L9